jgi:Bifunctional DNA primase/polymerase, N-terminal
MTKSAEPTSSQLATALRYGEAGLPIVPLHGKEKNGLCTCGVENCSQPGRHPRIKVGTTDPSLIKQYWTDWPNAAIAVETGNWNANIVAVMITDEAMDVPPTHESGRLRPPEWIELEEEESHTLMFHRGDDDAFLFRAGPGEVPDGKLKLAEGVTIFGKGQFVRLPSGFDAEGKRRFEPGCAVGEVDLAPLPKWIAARIRPAGRRRPLGWDVGFTDVV